MVNNKLFLKNIIIVFKYFIEEKHISSTYNEIFKYIRINSHICYVPGISYTTLGTALRYNFNQKNLTNTHNLVMYGPTQGLMNHNFYNYILIN